MNNENPTNTCKNGSNSDALEGLVVPAPHMATVVLLLLPTRDKS